MSDKTGRGEQVTTEALLAAALEELRDAARWGRVAAMWLGRHGLPGALTSARGYVDLLRGDLQQGAIELADVDRAGQSVDRALQDAGTAKAWLRGQADWSRGVTDIGAVAVGQRAGLGEALEREIEVVAAPSRWRVALSADEDRRLLAELAAAIAARADAGAPTRFEVRVYPAGDLSRARWMLIRASSSGAPYRLRNFEYSLDPYAGDSTTPGATTAALGGGAVVNGIEDACPRVLAACDRRASARGDVRPRGERPWTTARGARSP